MTRVIYVNGRYLPYAEAGVHAEDRGFQFADSIYEVCEILDGRLIDEGRHMDRLERSLAELRIERPMSRRALGPRHARGHQAQSRANGIALSTSLARGRAARLRLPAGDVPPTLVCLARRVDDAKREARANAGISVITAPDVRWGRCDIKTVMLLPACLAKDEAARAGASEAWFFDQEGFVTEGASSNAWIVDASGTVITRPNGRAILPGVTRKTLMDILNRENIPVIERPFRVDEAKAAREAFITSASGTVMPVVHIDGTPIANGCPGEMTRLLRSKFHQFAEISRVSSL